MQKVRDQHGPPRLPSVWPKSFLGQIDEQRQALISMGLEEFRRSLDRVNPSASNASFVADSQQQQR